MKININKNWIFPASALAVASLLISAYVANKNGALPKRTVDMTASIKRHLDGNVVDEKYVDQNIRVGMSRANIEDIIGVPESSHVFLGSVRYEYKVSQNHQDGRIGYLEGFDLTYDDHDKLRAIDKTTIMLKRKVKR